MDTVRSTATSSAIPGAPEQWSTRITFLVTGIGNSAWAALVPYAQARSGVGDGALGLLLLGLGIGSIVTMPASGALAARFGCRRVIAGSTLVVVVSLPLLATCTSYPALLASLTAFGAGIGGLDVTRNIQALIVQRASGRPMMSGFHGLFSLGGIVGAGGMSGLLVLGVPPPAATVCVSIPLLAMIAATALRLLPYESESEGPAFAVPRGLILVIGLLCFVLFLAEGAVLDWSGVFLTTVRHASDAYAGLGYAAFALTMTAGRLSGDRVVEALGSLKAVLFGTLIAACGFILTTVVPWWEATLVGYALVGAGLANTVPVMFTAVTRQCDVPENIAVPAITTIGYAGILAGPASIGLVAHLASLPVAFLMLTATLLAVASASRLL